MNLLESLLVLLIAIVALAGLGSLMEWRSAEESSLSSANDLLLVAGAAERYAIDRRNDLLSAATQAEGSEFSTEEGVPRDLSPYFSGRHRGKNKWGQHYRIAFRKIAFSTGANALMLFVVTEGGSTGHGGADTGSRFYSVTIRRAANAVQSMKQSLQNQYVAGYVNAANELVGQNQRLSLGEYGLHCAEGHIGLALMVTDSGADTGSGDYLYRTQIPGHPELNSMQTSLDLSDNSLENVSALSLKTRENAPKTCDETSIGTIIARESEHDSASLYVCKKRNSGYAWEALLDTGSPVVKNIVLAASNDRIPKPDCTNGGRAEIYVSPVGLAREDSLAPAITAYQSYAEDYDSQTWVVHLRVQALGDSSWSEPDASLAQMQVLTLCRPQ